MAERPKFIDLEANPFDSRRRPSQLSPRAFYYDGQIPPALSPLDAFAAQSRMMAKELNTKKDVDKRMSRLPPSMVTKSLSQHRADRPSIFRSLSQESGNSPVRDEDPPGNSPTFAHSHGRHVSQHPRISAIATPNNVNSDAERGLETPVNQRPPSTSTREFPLSLDYFGLPRTQSPAPSAGAMDSTNGSVQPQLLSQIFSHSKPVVQRPLSRNDSSKSQLDPMSAISPTKYIPRQESSDDDYTSSIAGSSFSFPRKLSSSSGISAPHSPLSPFAPKHTPRSPSITSEASVSLTQAPRAPWNFSRPRSTASLSLVSRPDSPAQHSPLIGTINPAPTAPHRTPSTSAQKLDEGSVDQDGYLSGGGSSYTYAKFTLPRGRMVSRNSTVFQGLSTPHFEWEGPIFQNNTLPEPEILTHRPKTAPAPRRRQTLDPGRSGYKPSGTAVPFDIPAATSLGASKESVDEPKPKTSSQSARPASPIPSITYVDRISTESTKSETKTGPHTSIEDVKSLSSKSNSTVRPTSLKAAATPTTGTAHYMSPEEHVTKGIECHENGALQESTYHLRIAAMQNHPTAMLLYALACRHGWGMRANQREGVQWLRKALDSAMNEVAEDEDPSGPPNTRDFNEKKTRRAQFALSIYELGVSHLNGWGIEQDKGLALRCFEVAGHWGDADAMTEAGFCYAKGIGCRKDMTAAAKFYRMAEDKGISMVGNSWIYKDKYNEPYENIRSRPTLRPTTSHSEKKSRDKSRTRSIFGRKKLQQHDPLPLPLPT